MKQFVSNRTIYKQINLYFYINIITKNIKKTQVLFCRTGCCKINTHNADIFIKSIDKYTHINGITFSGCYILKSRDIKIYLEIIVIHIYSHNIKSIKQYLYYCLNNKYYVYVQHKESDIPNVYEQIQYICLCLRKFL